MALIFILAIITFSPVIIALGFLLAYISDKLYERRAKKLAVPVGANIEQAVREHLRLISLKEGDK